MSKLATEKGLEDRRKIYPYSNDPTTLEELLASWTLLFKRSIDSGSKIPVNWELLSPSSKEMIRFSNSTLNVFPNYLSLEEVSKEADKNLRRIELQEFSTLKKIIEICLYRIDDVLKELENATKDFINLHQGEAELWAFISMRFRQLSSTLKNKIVHSTLIYSKLREWPLYPDRWSKVVLFAASGHKSDCLKCSSIAMDLLGDEIASTKLVEKYGRDTALTALKKRKLDQDLILVWQKWADANSYGMKYAYAHFDGEYLEKPISGLLDPRVQKTFEKPPVEDNPDRDFLYESAVSYLTYWNIVPACNSLVFHTTFTDSGLKFDKSKIYWHKNKHRLGVTRFLVNLPLEEFRSYTANCIAGINESEYSSMIFRERDIFLDAITLLKKDDFTSFGKEAYPAIENILRMFILMVTDENPDRLNTKLIMDSNLKGKEKHKENVRNVGTFLTLSSLLQNAKGLTPIEKNHSNELWKSVVNLLEFFMTHNGETGYGLNL